MTKKKMVLANMWVISFGQHFNIGASLFKTMWGSSVKLVLLILS